MKSFHPLINRQMAFNAQKNLYYTQQDRHVQFCDEIIALIKQADPAEDLSNPVLVDYLTEQALKAFYRSNQYISTTQADRQFLRAVYARLVADVRLGTVSVEVMERNHYARVAHWLAETNPFTKEINPPTEKYIKPVACAEYSASLQQHVLGINLSGLLQPVLDLGCGEQTNLVRALRSVGVEAYGIDRLCSSADEYVVATDWFDFECKPGCWGTVVANLSFSNQFLHHHLRQDGVYAQYARKYMEIVHSLKPGGAFHYAPSLPFIECYLPPDQFRVVNHPVDDLYARTIVTKQA